MPVKVKCSSCEKVLSVPDTARGKAVKCPACQTRIAVPAEAARPKSSAAKPKVKKAAKPADSEYALATLDMRKAEDASARICPKCGFDMKYQDEEDFECPQCGYDSEAGELGVKAKKKALKGPDPADFYPGLFKESWRFVGKNINLAMRTIIYTLVSLTIALGCGFLYLWISMWPPRWFLMLCFTISFLVIPGWMWVLDCEVIKLTLERKDKFKKLNFDFFLASAMGVAFVAWNCVVTMPLVCIPAMLGYFIVNRAGGRAEVVFPICLAIGILPAIWLLPVAMSHMVMPVPYKGWLVWKLVPLWAKNIKPLTVWLLLFLTTNIPSIAGVTTIAIVYGPSIVNIVEIMESNADIARRKFALVENPNAQRKSKGPAAPPPAKIPDPKNVEFTPLIVPGVILAVMSVINGFTCMFNMRINGRFTYYNKNSLDMIDKRKEYKYIAKERLDEDADEKPRTDMQLLGEAAAFFLVFDLLGAVFGMLYGAVMNSGHMRGGFYGLCIGHALGLLADYAVSVKFAFGTGAKWGAISLLGPIAFIIFTLQNWVERKGQFMRSAAGILFVPVLLAIWLMAGKFEDKPIVEPEMPPQAQQQAQGHGGHAEPAKAEPGKAPAAIAPVQPGPANGPAATEVGKPGAAQATPATTPPPP